VGQCLDGVSKFAGNAGEHFTETID
jgi:hypothetical protein